MDSTLDPKKKQKPKSAAEQASAIDDTVLGAETGTSAAKPRVWADVVKKSEREAGQAALDKDKFTPKTPQTTSGRVVAEYEGFGLGGASQVDRLSKEGKSVDEIVKIMKLRPKAKK